MSIEDKRETVETCFGTSCSFCERECPAYQIKKKKQFTSRGKNRIALGILRGEIELSEELAEAVFACTLCGSCDAHCALDNTETFIDLRTLLVGEGFSGEGHKFLIDNVMETGSAYGEEMAEPREGDTLLFVGCQYGFKKNALEKVVRVLKKFGIEPRIEEEICCGYPLKAYGFSDEFEQHKANFIERYGTQEVITLCPTCSIFLRDEYGIEVKHALELVKEKLEDADIKPFDKKITYHDPCHLARYFELIEGPRDVLKALGAEIVEMENNRYFTHCCGGGGGIVTSDPELYSDMGKRRIGQAVATETDILVTMCPTCELTLKKAAREHGEGIKVKGIWDVLWSAVK